MPQAKTGQVHVEETFDNVVVFSEATWLERTGDAAVDAAGATEEGEVADADGELLEAPMPTEMLSRRLHKSWSYAAGAAAEHAGTAGSSSGAGGIRAALEAAGGKLKARPAEAAESADEGDEEGGEEGGAEEEPEAKRRPSRERKRASYVDKG